MSNTLYIHIGYWIVILLILFVGYLIYPKKQKKSSKRAGKNFCIGQGCPQKVNTISTSLEKKQVLLNMPSDDKDWHCLEAYFDNTYDGFIQKLRNNYPLSNEDIHLIILICLEVSNKQIASYYHIQLASLATHRYRIAKKMGLKEVKSIYEAITGMLRNEKY